MKNRLHITVCTGENSASLMVDDGDDAYIRTVSLDRDSDRDPVLDSIAKVLREEQAQPGLIPRGGTVGGELDEPGKEHE